MQGHAGHPGRSACQCAATTRLQRGRGWAGKGSGRRRSGIDDQDQGAEGTNARRRFGHVCSTFAPQPEPSRAAADRAQGCPRRKLGAGSLAVAAAAAAASNIRHLTDVLPCNLQEICRASTGTTQPAAADRILRPEVSVPRSAKW